MQAAEIRGQTWRGVGTQYRDIPGYLSFRYPRIYWDVLYCSTCDRYVGGAASSSPSSSMAPSASSRAAVAAASNSATFVATTSLPNVCTSSLRPMYQVPNRPLLSSGLRAYLPWTAYSSELDAS